MRRTALVAAGLLCCAALAHASVLVLDSKQNAYLKGSAKQTTTTQELQSLVAALTGLQPGVHIDSATSQQIASLLAPSPLKKPQAHVSLSLAGLTAEDIAKFLEGRQGVQAALEGDQHTAEAVTDLITSLASGNPDVQFQLLEQVAAQRCRGRDCLAELLPDALAAIGASYDQATKKLTLADGTELDLEQLEDKAFAMELLGATAGAQAVLDQLRQYGAEDIAVMDMTMLGLQGLASKYGKDSAETLSAKSTLLAVLEAFTGMLDKHFDGDVTFQVALFDSAPSAQDTASALAWKQQRHARVLQSVQASDFPGSDAEQVAAAKQFTTKAAGYGAFILLVYFIAAGLYCMCNMPFKRDTLLWGAKKD